jgi:uncharacterized protein
MNKRQAPPTIRVENASRGATLVTRGRAADNSWTRFRGLIGHPPLAEGEGLLIVPCSSIHTHFMGFPIDVLYVNAEQEVVGVDRDLKPWRFGRFYRRVRYVIELPAGTAAATGTQVGDRLQVEGYTF